MPSLDLHSVLGLGVAIAALLTALCATLAGSLGASRSARLLTASGLSFTLTLATRFVAGESPSWTGLALAWTLQVLAAALCLSALLETIRPRPREDGPPWSALAMLMATMWFALWAMPAPDLGAFVCAVGNLLCSLMSVRVGLRIADAPLAPARRTLLVAFGLAALLSLYVALARLARIQFGVDVVAPAPTAFLAVVVCCAISIGFVQLLYLQTHASARELACIDALTGALNRRGFTERFARLRADPRASRSGALLLIDIDRFKTVNDTHGHAVGDEMLGWFAATLRRFLRGEDLLVRLGGEEFCIVLPGVDVPQALQVAERMRVALEQRCVAHTSAGPLRLTASFGVAPFGPEDDSLDARLREADKALYGAKRAGRNRVEGGSDDSTALLPT